MSNIDNLPQASKTKVETILAKAKAKIEAEQNKTTPNAKEIADIVATPATKPGDIVPNVGDDFVDSIKVITVKLPARQNNPAPAVIEAEIIEGPAPLNKTKAAALDKKLVAAVTTVGNSMGTLSDLVAQAKDGQIHVALGFASWTAYFAERVTTPMMAIGERKAVASMLHDEGMSNRAIGAVLGVSHATVVSDIKATKATQPKPVGAPATPKKTVGKDGKTYTRTATQKKTAAQPKPQPVVAKKKSDLEIRLDIVTADAENILEDITTLVGNLETLYGTDGYEYGSDKNVLALLAKARKAMAVSALPASPARPKTNTKGA